MVGKTSIIRRFIYGTLANEEDVYYTTGYEFHQRILDVKLRDHASSELRQSKVNLQIIDTSFTEVDGGYLETILAIADLAIICVAKNSLCSFENVRDNWLNIVQATAPDIPISLLLSKLDTESEQVQLHDLQALQKQTQSIIMTCLLYTSPSPRDRQKSRMPSSA